MMNTVEKLLSKLRSAKEKLNRLQMSCSEDEEDELPAEVTKEQPVVIEESKAWKEAMRNTLTEEFASDEIRKRFVNTDIPTKEEIVNMGINLSLRVENVRAFTKVGTSTLNVFPKTLREIVMLRDKYGSATCVDDETTTPPKS